MVKTVPPGARLILLALCTAAAAAGCDKAQLLAPTKSTITLSAPARILPPGGRTEITAMVVEQAGTPVQNGTTVRFSTNLGRVDPVETQTRNGFAVTTFFSGDDSGIARIRASSGGATGADNSDVVEITIGAAAVNTVTLRASPGSVGPQGGTVELIATVVGENGQALQRVGVTFNTDQGRLSDTNAVTDTIGQARVTLTTAQKATVSATAGTKTSSNVTVDLRAGPNVSISCTPASGTGNCAAVQASATNNTATVLFTVKKVSGSSTLRTATLDFGDGTSQALGNLASDATITHAYAGPSDSNSRAYTATVQATDINAESIAASTVVILTPKPTITPINVALSATCAIATSAGQRCTFDADATGGGEGGTGNAAIQSYTWDFDDGTSEVTTSGDTTAHVYEEDGRYVVTVTARTADGRSATGRTEVLIELD